MSSWGGGYKRVSVKSIRVDMPDIKRRMKTNHVEELARDIRAHGDEPIHAITVRAETSAIVCGRDRYSALLLNGAKKAWVHIFDGTDAEAQELELAENIYRRHSDGERAQSLARLVELQKQKIRAEEKAASGDNVPASSGANGRNRSEQAVTSEARKAVARAAGVSPAAVKKAEQRAAAAEEADETKHEADAPPQLPARFNTFGLFPDHDEIREIGLAVDRLHGWDGELKKLLSHLTTVEKLGGCLAPAHVQKIRERLQAAGHAVRDAIPTSLCYFCKSLDKLKTACPACGGTGVVGVHGGDNVPPELKADGDKARVAVNGRFVLVGAAEGAAHEDKPSMATKTITVRGADGAVVDLNEVGDEPGDDEQAF